MNGEELCHVLTEVSSSLIECVRYNTETQRLSLWFRGKAGLDKIYIYNGVPVNGVPVETYQELIEAPSAGSYYARRIKGRFECSKVPIR